MIRLATDLLERDEPVVLVLDEVERLTDPAVPAQLELLMRLAGLSLRLVLLSRIDPLLPDAAVPHGGRHDRDPHGRPGLHRRRRPASSCCARDMHLSRASLAALVTRTEGWAAGLQLAALTRSHLPSAERDAETDELADRGPRREPGGVPHPGGPGRPAAAPARLPAADQRPRAGLGRAGGGADRRARRRHGAADPGAGQHPDGGRSATCPGATARTPCCVSCCGRQLAYRTPELVPELHLRAARWFARTGMALQAVSHYGSAGSWEEAAEMVVDDVLIVEALRPSSPPLVQRLADMPEDTPGAPAGVVRAAVALGPGRRAGMRRGPGPRRAGSRRRSRAAPGRGPRRHPAGVRRTRPDPGETLVCVDAGGGRPQRARAQGRRRAAGRRPGPSTPTCSRCCCRPRGSPAVHG